MPDREPLSDAAIADALDDLPDWVHEDDKLKTTVELTDFREAVSFIVEMAFYAEEMNHHPEISNVYNTVDIALTTHDAGDKVTATDVKLARQIDALI
jgi:4a-hydroxytetrahydrobiopterin dehydratase